MATALKCCRARAPIAPLPWFGDLLWSSLARLALASLTGYSKRPDLPLVQLWRHCFGSDWTLTARGDTVGLAPAWLLFESPSQQVLALSGTDNESQLLGQILSLTSPPAGSLRYSVAVYFQTATTLLLSNMSAAGVVLGLKPLTIVGYSLGAAVTCTCIDRLNLGFPSLKLAWLSVGCPRAFGFNSWRFLRSFPHAAVGMKDDLVTYVPPAPLDWAWLLPVVPTPVKLTWLLYREPPSMRSLDQLGREVDYYPGAAGIAGLSAGILVDWHLHGTWGRFANHDLKTYLLAMSAAAFLEGIDQLKPWVVGNRVRDVVTPVRLP